MFIRSCWYVVGWSADLAAGQIFPMTIIGERIVFFRLADGSPVALQDRCCHKRAKLSLGRLEGECLRCMYHGLKFDASGQCVEIPGQDIIPQNARVATFSVADRGGWLWVWMGDPNAANYDLIPPVIGVDDPAWDLRIGQMDYAANYELINDNLTDFSHLSFVHPASFGASSSFAEIRPTVKRIDRGVRVSRWMGGGGEENRNVASAAGRSAEAPVSFMTYDYLVPGILIMRNATYRLSDYPDDGVSPPTGTPVMANVSCQAVTPMTDDTSRYFFSIGPRSGPNSAIAAEKFHAVIKIAFEEDRAMIESQAANIKAAPGSSEMMTTADVGPVQFRSIIRALLKAEVLKAGPGEVEPLNVNTKEPVPAA